MKPLKLTLRAFGPFAGEESVDFTRYGEHAFVLINGPTGAGKTTILDGLCYALYGEASGAGRSEHFLRSQRSSREVICQAELLFRIGPRAFSIKRRPAQTILHKGALRELPHQVEFCEVDADGQLLGERSTKVGEVRERIEALVGFSSDQFRQVVVLPQGEFRRLLLAKSDDKEKILEKLFNSGRFKLVEESLKRRRAAFSGELRELKAAIDGILASQGVTSAGELDELLAQAIDERTTLAVTQRELLVRQQAAQAELRRAQQAAERFAEQELALAAVTALEAQRPAREAGAVQLAAATRALRLVDLDEALGREQREQAARVQAGVALDERIARRTAQVEVETAAVVTARGEYARIAEEIAEQTRLRAQLEQHRELSAVRQARQGAEAALAAAQQERDALFATLVAGEARIAGLTAQIEELAVTAGDGGRVEEVIVRYAQFVQTRADLDAALLRQQSIAGDLIAAEALCREVVLLRAAGRNDYDELHRAFRSGHAAHLAATLVDGLPCPVCGSSSHPQPATASATMPGAASLDAAAAALRALDLRVEEAQGRCAALTAEQQGCAAGVEHLRAALVEVAQSSLAELQAELEGLRARQRATSAAATALQRSRQERDAALATLGRQREALAGAESTLLAARMEVERCAALEASAAAAVGVMSEAEVVTRIAAIDAFVGAATAGLRTAEEAFSVASAAMQQDHGEQRQLAEQILGGDERLRELVASFGARLAQEGFSDAAGYRASRMNPEELSRLSADHERFRTELAAAQVHLVRAEAGCAGLVRPDLAALRSTVEAFEREVGAGQQEMGVRDGQITALEAAQQSIGARGRRMTALEEEFSVVGRLAEVVGGQNPQRMTLQRYVLAALFGEVAIAASRRLEKMSRGRYHLIRSEAPRDGKSTGGLDIDVIDDHSGERRPAYTLSGGESFLASLSLALGLSDVVLAQSGGRYLDCIFIDEGFGTLDGETLDVALNTLIELHRAGRMIGIISHVAELKERIPCRIDVVAQREGSIIKQYD